MKWQQWFCLLLLLVSGMGLSMFRLGSDALVDYDEATYAQVFAEAVRSSDFISFTRLSQPWFEKPPLYFWLMAGSTSIFGISEFAMRLPAALAGIGTILLVWAITRIYTRNIWFTGFAGAILLTTGTFLSPARQVRMDVPVVFFLILAFYAFLKGRDHPVWYLGMGIACALGVLVKSVIGFFILPIILIASLIQREWQWLKSRYSWLGAVAGLAILLPWHLYESARFGKAFWNDYLLYHIVQRFAHPILGGNVTTLSYLELLSRFAEPWILVFPAALFLLPAFRRKAAEEYRLLLSLACIVGFIFLTFAAARTKLLFYLVPMYPFMSIYLALTAKVLYERLKGESVRELFAAACVMLTGIGLACSLYYQFSSPNEARAIAEEERQVGQFLADYEPKLPLLALNHFYWETIQYYSGGRKISSADPDAIEPDRSLLITSTGTLEQYSPSHPLLQRGRIVLQTPAITLIEVAEK